MAFKSHASSPLPSLQSFSSLIWIKKYSCSTKWHAWFFCKKNRNHDFFFVKNKGTHDFLEYFFPTAFHVASPSRRLITPASKRCLLTARKLRRQLISRLIIIKLILENHQIKSNEPRTPALLIRYSPLSRSALSLFSPPPPGLRHSQSTLRFPFVYSSSANPHPPRVPPLSAHADPPPRIRRRRPNLIRASRVRDGARRGGGGCGGGHGVRGGHRGAQALPRRRGGGHRGLRGAAGARARGRRPARRARPRRPRWVHQGLWPGVSAIFFLFFSFFNSVSAEAAAIQKSASPLVSASLARKLCNACCLLFFQF